MPTGTVQSTISAGGVSIQSTISRYATGQFGHEVPLPAGTDGSLTTRTDDDTGVVTAAGHGLSVSDVVDVYWDGGVRYGMDVTGVAGNDVTVDGGAGDNLPAQDTAVVIVEQVVIDTDWDGDLLELVAAWADRRAHVHFTEEDNTSIHAQELTANEAWYWAKNTGVTNPLTGDPVGKVKTSNGTTTATTLKLCGVYAST